jgi:hypothetical protein
MDLIQYLAEKRANLTDDEGNKTDLQLLQEYLDEMKSSGMVGETERAEEMVRGLLNQKGEDGLSIIDLQNQIRKVNQ